jgi:hypothetical protein
MRQNAALRSLNEMNDFDGNPAIGGVIRRKVANYSTLFLAVDYSVGAVHWNGMLLYRTLHATDSCRYRAIHIPFDSVSALEIKNSLSAFGYPHLQYSAIWPADPPGEMLTHKTVSKLVIPGMHS